MDLIPALRTTLTALSSPNNDVCVAECKSLDSGQLGLPEKKYVINFLYISGSPSHSQKRGYGDTLSNFLNEN